MHLMRVHWKPSCRDVDVVVTSELGLSQRHPFVVVVTATPMLPVTANLASRNFRNCNEFNQHFGLHLLYVSEPQNIILGTPDIRRPGCVVKAVVDVLASNRRQAIINHSPMIAAPCNIYKYTLALLPLWLKLWLIEVRRSMRLSLLTSIPADTLRNNDVVIKSKRRHFDVITSKWPRLTDVVSLLTAVILYDLKHPHWNGKVFILMKCSSLAALEVVKMTTSSAASDENFVKMTTFLFQCTAMCSTVCLSAEMTWHRAILGWFYKRAPGVRNPWLDDRWPWAFVNVALKWNKHTLIDEKFIIKECSGDLKNLWWKLL